jgi:hypothetical protein
VELSDGTSLLNAGGDQQCLQDQRTLDEDVQPPVEDQGLAQGRLQPVERRDVPVSIRPFVRARERSTLNFRCIDL